MRKPFMAGNWKLHKTIGESVQVAKLLRIKLADVSDVDVAICPTFTSLASTCEILRETNVTVGAQNCHWEPQGAFTGEISAELVADTGCRVVLIGHSERRQFFGETDETVNRRLGAALRAGLHPIVCVGESLDQRESGVTESVVEKQVRGALDGYSSDQLTHLTLAYEPVWAIGTGRTATPEQAQAVHAHLRSILASAVGIDLANRIRIQYGGSVKATNVAELMACPDIDGALVGGASLEADSFSQIVHF